MINCFCCGGPKGCGLILRWIPGEKIAYYTLVYNRKEESKEKPVSGDRTPDYCPECGAVDLTEISE